MGILSGLLLVSLLPFVCMVKRIHPPSLLQNLDAESLENNTLKSYTGYHESSNLQSIIGNYGNHTLRPYKEDSENSTFRLIKRQVTEEYVIPHRQPRAQKASVETVCVNPTMRNVDECIENTDPQLVEKCVPGLAKTLTDEGTAGDLFKGNVDESEACLKRAFARCSFDSRHRIKTKIKKVVGITLDIAFQDEFEMDSCDQRSINELMDEVQECFQYKRYDQQPLPSRGNISTEIIQMAGQCIEDHTAFMCALQDRNLFRSIIQRLINMLREESMNILDRYGKGDTNHTRLCLMWMDYNRLENCERDFFDYVQCLQNGTNHPTLFKNVHNCFRKALRVCPTSTAQSLIKILAGAIEGKAGQEPSGMEIDTHPQAVDESCTKEKIRSSVAKLIQCARNMLKNTPNENLISILEAIAKCARTVDFPGCTFHKSSTFRNAINELHDAAGRVVQSSPVRDNDRTCIVSFTGPVQEDCVTTLFLYYISSQHAHHTPESVGKRRDKAKLCFQVHFKGCSFNQVDNILQMYASMVGIPLTGLRPSQAITRVTLPEGVIWCETRFFGNDVPLPTTRGMEFPREDHFWIEHVTPTTVSEFDVTPPRDFLHEGMPEVQPRIEYVTRAPHEYFENEGPTTVHDVEFTIHTKNWGVTFPQWTPKEYVFSPVTRPWGEEHVTPTEVTRNKMKIQVVEIYAEKGVSQPRPQVIAPVEAKPWVEHRAPTTYRPYTKRVKSKIVHLYQKNVIIEEIESAQKPPETIEFIAPTEVSREVIPVHSQEIISSLIAKLEMIHHYPPERMEIVTEAKIPTTTRVYEFTPKRRMYPEGWKKVIVEEKRIFPEEKPEFVDHVTPTTVETMRLKPQRKSKTFILKAIFYKVEHFYPSEEEVTNEERFTTERIHVPRREMELPPESISPTKVSHIRILVKEVPSQFESPLPEVKPIYIRPMESPYEEYITPTTVNEFEFTVTDRKVFKMPPAPTQEVYIPPEGKQYVEVVQIPKTEYQKIQPKPIPYEDHIQPTEAHFQHYPIYPKKEEDHKPFEFRTIIVVPEERFHTERLPQTTTRTTRMPLPPRSQVIIRERVQPSVSVHTPENKVYIIHRTTKPPKPYYIESPIEVIREEKPPIIPEERVKRPLCPGKTNEEAFEVIPGGELDHGLYKKSIIIQNQGGSCMDRCMSGQSPECYHHDYSDTQRCCQDLCSPQGGSPPATDSSCMGRCMSGNSPECSHHGYGGTQQCCQKLCSDHRGSPPATDSSCMGKCMSGGSPECSRSDTQRCCQKLCSDQRGSPPATDSSCMGKCMSGGSPECSHSDTQRCCQKLCSDQRGTSPSRDNSCIGRCMSGNSPECSRTRHKSKQQCCQELCSRSSVPGIEQCERLCVEEESFECRSALFDEVTGECLLSPESRKSRPESFHRVPIPHVSYIENHCIPEREVITPTVGREMWAPPVRRVHVEEVTPPEITYQRYPPPIVPEERAIESPPVERMIIIKPEESRTRFEIPTTKRSIHKIIISPIEFSVPVPEVEVVTFTPVVGHTERIPGVTYKFFEFPPKEQRVRTTRPPIVPHREMRLPTPTEYSIRRTPTPTSRSIIRVKEIPYTETVTPINIHVMVVKPIQVPEEREETVPTPRMVYFKPDIFEFVEQQGRKPGKPHKFTVPVEEVTKGYGPITPEVMRLAPKPKLIVKIFRPTPQVQFTIQPMRIPTVQERPQPEINIQVISPKEKVYIETVTGSTVREMRITPTPQTESFEREHTTSRNYLIPIYPEEEENQIPAPQPEVIYVQHIPTSSEDYRVPTTTEKFVIRVRPEVQTQGMPVESKKLIYHRLEIDSVRMHVTPTTVRDYDFPVREDVHFQEMPARTPHVYVFTPRTPSYKEYVPQTTTSFYHYTVRERVWPESMGPMPTEIARIVPTVEHVADSRISVTEIKIFKVEIKEYTCVKKPSPSVPHETISSFISCQKINRKCSTQVFQQWKMRIEQCVTAMMAREGVSLEHMTNQETQDMIHAYVIKCIQKIGDTPCRDKKLTFFDLKVVNELVMVHSDVHEHGAAKSPEMMEENMFAMQKCVAMTDENKLESCCPGLYHVLSNVVLYRNPIHVLTVKKSPPAHCITGSLGHCDPETRQNMELILHMNFGNACIRLTTPDEPTTCHVVTRRTRAGGECESKDVSSFIRSTRSCLSTENKGGTIVGLFDTLQTCATPHIPGTCNIRRWPHVQRILRMMTDFLVNNTAGSKCLHQLSSNETTLCVRSLADLIPSIPEVVDINELMRPIVGCISSALSSCTPTISLKLMQFVLNVTDAEPIDLHNIEIPVSQSSISSIKHNDLDINICQNNVKSPTKQGMKRPTFSDDCVPVYPDFSTRKAREARGEPQYILVKSCSEERVNKWLKELKDCVEEKTTRIGLKNPEYLTLPRLLIIIKTCIDNKGPLKCRPKYLPDFKRIIKSIVDVARQNSLTTQHSQCLQQLKIENFPRCVPVLHKFLALTTDEKFFLTNQKKSMQCLKEYLKDCDESTVEQLLDIQELAMVQEASSLYRYSDGDLIKCSPAHLRFDPSGVFSDLPSTEDCGPGEVAVRKKREVPVSHALLRGYEPSAKSWDYGAPTEDPMQKRIVRSSPTRECGPRDYVSYLVELKNCAKKRLHLKYRKARDSCHLLSVKELFDAMTECGIEIEVNPLPCTITTEEQISKFLYSFSKVLKIGGQANNEMCLEHNSCALDKTPPLQECSSSFYKFLKTGDTEKNRLRKVINGTVEAPACLTSIWASCPAEVSSLTIPIVLNALGLDFDTAMAEGSKIVSCRMGDSKESKLVGALKSMKCLKNISVHEDSSPQLSLLDACKPCVRKKDGICMYNDVTDMFKTVDADILAIGRCLKVLKLNDNCIQNVTGRVTTECLPLFYKFIQHLKGGRVLNLIDSLQDFNRCLVNFKSECPEDIHQFVTEIYYEVVGLNSAFTY